ncbi:MAG: inositol monophosphatase family protein [Anaerolineaceae bacterium]
MQPDLNFLTDIALRSGSMQREMQNQDLDIHLKGRADLVTKADKAVEAYLLEQILDRFPSHSIIAEESGKHEGDPAHQWFIDPLDGTLNYAHGMPFYAVSIAYACNGKLHLGVIYDPNLDECFSAGLGQGAWFNGQPMRVSKTENLEDSLLITGFRAALFDTPRSNINHFLLFSRLSQGVRRLGSAALALAYVACGRLEGYWELQLYPWDLAAGTLLVQEAGGMVTGLYGEMTPPDAQTNILAANPRIFPQMLSALREERERSQSQES